MKRVQTNQEAFMARGSQYAVAWRILEAGCEVPPSLEVFEHELGVARKENPTLPVEGMARRLSERYHRVQGFFD